MTCFEKKLSNHVSTVSSTDLPLSKTSSKSRTFNVKNDQIIYIPAEKSADESSLIAPTEMLFSALIQNKPSSMPGSPNKPWEHLTWLTWMVSQSMHVLDTDRTSIVAKCDSNSPSHGSVVVDDEILGGTEIAVSFCFSACRNCSFALLIPKFRISPIAPGAALSLLGNSVDS